MPTDDVARFVVSWHKSTHSVGACLETAVVDATIVGGLITGYTLVSSREPGPGAGAGGGIGLDDLRRAADTAAEDAETELGIRADAPGPRPGPELDQYCLTMAEHLAQELFPDGIRARSIRDDAVLGTGQGVRGFLGLPSTAWVTVSSWRALTEAIDRAGPGTVAIAVIGRRMRAPREPGGAIPATLSHTIVLTHTSDNGITVTDPARRPDSRSPGHDTRPLTDTAESVIGTTADRLGPLADTRALIIGRAGEIITPPRTGIWGPGRGVGALIDPADPRTGSSHAPPGGVQPMDVDQVQETADTAGPDGLPINTAATDATDATAARVTQHADNLIDRMSRDPITGHDVSDIDLAASSQVFAENQELEDLWGDSERLPGDCLMHALLDSASDWLPANARTVQRIRDRLADALEDPDAPQYRENLEAQALRFLAEDHAGQWYRPDSADWVQTVHEYTITHAVDWDQIITDLRTPGSWENAAGDIAPILAGWVFNLRIHVQQGNNARPYVIGDEGGYSIFLSRTGNHWQTPDEEEPETGRPALDEMEGIEEGGDASPAPASVPDLGPDGLPGLPITATDTDARMNRHADTLIERMNSGRLTGHDIGDVDITVRPQVFAEIQDRHPDEYRTWRQDGSVFYGRVGDVPSGEAPILPAGGVDLANSDVGAVDDQPGRPGDSRGGTMGSSSALWGALDPALRAGEADPVEVALDPVEAWLDARGLRRLPTATGRHDFFTARVATAGPGTLLDMDDPAQIREYLATQLLASQQLRDRATPAIQRFLAEQSADQHIHDQRAMFFPLLQNLTHEYMLAGRTLEQATREAEDNITDFIDDREALMESYVFPVSEQRWGEISSQIRTPDPWADIGGDVIPLLAALVFDLRITVVSNGGAFPVGNERHRITLVRTGDYWGATLRTVR